MRFWLLLLIGLPVLGLFSPAMSVGQPLPKDIPELKVLQRWVGKWQVDVTIKKGPLYPKGVSTKGAAQNTEWVLGGRYIQLNFQKDLYQQTYLITYDLNQKAYRQWLFDSAGQAIEFTGKWNETTQTMTWTGQEKGKGFYKVHVKFHGPDDYDSHAVITDTNGQVLVDQYALAKRQKE
jgi:hypothetical protein